MADLHNVEPVEGEQGVIFGVMRNVPDPYTGETRNIVVRDADNGFWNALLNEAEQENTSTRFAVVGSPGIGKSTTVAFAIRLLLLQEKTVVYKYRTPDNTGYYIQFKPETSSAESGETMKNSSSSETGDRHNSIPKVEIHLFPEDTKTSEIPSLLDPETYYIVNPGKTKTSCDPGPFVVCRVIIVASPDEQHWGGSAFEKDDDKALGVATFDISQLDLFLSSKLRPHNSRESNFKTVTCWSSIPYSVVYPGRCLSRIEKTGIR
mmetsp:Transcript_11453/g.16314  ORF Transcript_11453/g.16314 Transcript_11453/m.16314 type:complete len:263 (+) Transcript_11453:1872-2660(+)